MSEQIKGTYLCLLDDVNLEESITLDEFDVSYYSVKELILFLKGSDEGVSSEEMHRLEAYSKFPWACMETIISQDKIKNDLSRRLLILNLAWQHAGMVSWKPFTELIRTLNLLKESPGPVISRQFYYRLCPNTKTTAEIGKVIYGEPAFDIIDNVSSSHIRPLLLEYDLNQKDVVGFSKLREQLNKCLSKDAVLCNSHLRTAIHYFEKGDKVFKAMPLIGSFNAIDPLMSYEAALEALVVLEHENKVSEKLASRVYAIINNRISEVQNLCKRVFWLRSKVAHGARTIEEIERLIIHKPNKEIKDEKRKITIPEGNYEKLFLSSYVFPGLLVNLREITRRAIRFFCDEFSKGNGREKTINKLKNHN